MALHFTQNGAAVEVEQIWVVSARQDAEGNWIQMGGKVARLPNGAYCHGDGDLLPFESEEDIRQIFTSRDREGSACILPEMQNLMEAVLEWFAHRADYDETVVRKVVLNRKGWPEFEDGTPAEEADLYAYFEPGPALSAAIVGLYARRDVENQSARAAKPDFYQQPSPPPGEIKVAGEAVDRPKSLVKPRGRHTSKNKSAKAPAKAAVNPTPAKQPEVAAAAG